MRSQSEETDERKKHRAAETKMVAQYLDGRFARTALLRKQAPTRSVPVNAGPEDDQAPATRAFPLGILAAGTLLGGVLVAPLIFFITSSGPFAPAEVRDGRIAAAKPEISSDPRSISTPLVLVSTPYPSRTQQPVSRTTTVAASPRAPKQSAPAKRAVSTMVAQIPKPAPPPQEVTIPLNTQWPVSTEFGTFNVRILDHGIRTISVWINGQGPLRIDKVKGFENDGTNIAQIHSLPGADVYYVDRISVSSDKCVLKIIPKRS
jgi:hypothetical protein